MDLFIPRLVDSSSKKKGARKGEASTIGHLSSGKDKSVKNMEAIIQPTDLRPEQFVGLSAALCTITALTIGIRIYSNLNHSRKLHADDCG